MSSPPPTTETYDLELSHDERWVVHDVLVTHVDEALDDERSPPEWTLRTIDAVESGATSVTEEQAAHLYDLLRDRVDAANAPESDVVHGTAVLERLEPIALEA